ncbi:MAG: hypothetical protein RL006_303 [Chloroflexota bacterium]|jgi:hypothetical protein
MNLRSLAFGLAALLFVGGCTSTPEPSASLLYTATRSWSNGMEERVEVYADGKTIMTHGDYEERITLPADQMAELAAAAGTPADPGSNSDDPILGVTVSGSPEVRPAALTLGSIAELLNRLLDSHVLHE